LLFFISYVLKQDPSSKKSKESDKLFAKEHGRDEKKKKMPESKGFKIPKKVQSVLFNDLLTSVFVGRWGLCWHGFPLWKM